VTLVETSVVIPIRNHFAITGEERGKTGWTRPEDTEVVLSRTTKPVMCCRGCANAVVVKFVSSCGVCCVKSHKDRVVIVPYEHICMIHGLILPDHLEDELTCTCTLSSTVNQLNREVYEFF
jgi:hypothetical protein